MKYLKISKYAGLSILTLVLFFACKKVKTDEPIGDGGQQIIRIMKYGSKEAAPFSASALTLDLSLPTYDFQCVLEYSSSQVPTSDVTVTVAYDAAALSAFNAAQPAGGIIYIPMTATQYSILNTTTTIRAGQAISEPITIRFRPDQLDPSKSYMVPISITNIAGAPANVVKAPASSTAYLHVIGNPLAGTYQDYGQRFNYTGTVAWPGGPAAGLGLATAPGVPSVLPPAGITGTTVYNFTNNCSPVDAQTVSMSMGNVPDPAGGLALYYITGNATFSAITFDHSGTFNSGYSNILRYVRGYVPPTPTQKPAFRLVTHYNNTTGAAGNDRIIDETFIHL
jgi:Domain of unknown function (DUF1735)